MKLFDLLLFGVAFFSAFPVFVLVRTGAGSGVQVTLFLAMIAAIRPALTLLGRGALTFRATRADVALCALIAAVVLSIAIRFPSLAPQDWTGFIRNFIGGLVPAVFVYYVVRYSCSMWSRVELVTRALLLSAVVSCVYAIYGYYVTQILGGSSPHWLFNNPAFGADVIVPGEYFMPRATGFMSEPSLLVAFLVAVLPLAAAQRRWWMAALIGITLVLTFSPTVIVLGVLVALALTSRSGRRVTRQFFAGLVGTVLAVSLLVGAASLAGVGDRLGLPMIWTSAAGIVNRLPVVGTSQDISVLARIDSIAVGLRLWRERPLTGHGWGVPLDERYLALQDPQVLATRGGAQRGAHSAIVDIMTRSGLLGAVIAILFVVLIARSAQRAVRSRPPAEARLAWAYWAGFITMVCQLAISSAQWPQLYFVPLIAAVTASLEFAKSEPEARETATLSPRLYPVPVASGTR